MQTTKSVIISCAGIGSRLGLGTTKALIELEGKTLIHWQLDLFRNVQDIRVVVGFQAAEVVAEVRKYRPDAVFVYNHNYFSTKTGASYFLGARHGCEYSIEVDGDLIIHPEDATRLLALDEEWIAYADKHSEDAVFVNVDSNGNVISFSREDGDFEWTGPCCLKRNRVIYSPDNVYNQLENYLPLKGIKIRACDIDTYRDYERAKNLIKEWNLQDEC